MSVIINKSTMSLPLWLQMTGRGSRPYPGKETFTIVDMGGNAITHGDWCESRNWSDMFHNPDKPKEGGEAPSKACVSCGIVIHASVKICKHCGANNSKPVQYDDSIIKFELLNSKKPIYIHIPSLIETYSVKTTADGKPYKELFVLHLIKQNIITHAKRVWKLKMINDETAYKLIALYQGKVQEWCELKSKNYNQWLRKSTGKWFMEDLKRTFGWEPSKISNHI